MKRLGLLTLLCAAAIGGVFSVPLLAQDEVDTIVYEVNDPPTLSPSLSIYENGALVSTQPALDFTTTGGLCTLGTGKVTCDFSAIGGSGAPTTAKYWTGAEDSGLSAEFDLSGFTGIVFNTAGTPSQYAGTSCTNQFVRSFSASGVATCAAVANADITNSTIDLTTKVTGTLPIANGGTNLTAAADDNVMVGNGTTWQSKALPNCADSAGNHINYTAASNSFSCGTSVPSSVLTTAFGGSGSSHAMGYVPDPGATAGTGKMLSESGSFVTVGQRRTHFSCFEDFTGSRGSATSSLASGTCGFSQVSNGSSATGQQNTNTPVSADVNRPGVTNIGIGVAAGGWTNEYTGPAFVLAGGDRYDFACKWKALSDATDRWHSEIGLYNPNDNASIQEGAWFSWEDDVNSANYTFNICKSNSCETNNSTTAPTADTWYILSVVPNAALTSIDFQVNGTSIGTTTTTAKFPSAPVRIGFRMVRVSGTTNDRSISCDYVSVDKAELSR